jgi:hypothetical protein
MDVDERSKHRFHLTQGASDIGGFHGFDAGHLEAAVHDIHAGQEKAAGARNLCPKTGSLDLCAILWALRNLQNGFNVTYICRIATKGKGFVSVSMQIPDGLNTHLKIFFKLRFTDENLILTECYRHIASIKACCLESLRLVELK